MTTLHDQIHEELSRRENELIDLHRRIVQIPTINHGGGTSAQEILVAKAAAEYLRGAGVKDIEIVESEPERGNLLAAIGDAGGKSMLWMSHSDVVPAGDESAWTHPPFSAAIDEGRIWGRGSNDCKMLVAAQLFAQACLARMNVPGLGRLKVAVGADEEVGGALGFGWLAKNRAEFLKSDLAICEGGGECLGQFTGDTPAIAVGIGEKGRFEVTFMARGTGGHAAMPWTAHNPLDTLAELHRRIRSWAPQLSAEAPIFMRLAQWIDHDGELAPGDLEGAIELIKTRAPGLINNLRGASRMTFTPTMIHGGEKANAITTDAKLICDCRLLPGQTKKDIEKLCADLVAGLKNVIYEIATTTGPSVSPFNDELEGMFHRACTRALGRDVEIAPILCIGATDARFVRELGTPVYGFQLDHPDADPARLGIHCIDESIEVRMLLPCALSLAHLAVEFLQGQPTS